METSVIDMHTTGSDLSVYVSFWDKEIEDYRKGLLTFDTGASVTTVSKDALYDLGYNVVEGKIRKITTASNVEYVREVFIEKFCIGEYELENVLVYAHDFPEESFTTGVLGLNVLSQFDINMLFSKRQIVLTKIT